MCDYSTGLVILVGGGGGILDFKWQGWSNGGKNQNPNKFLDQKLTPKNPMLHFRALASLVVLYSQNYSCMWPKYTGITTTLRIGLNTPKNLYLNQVTQKRLLTKYPTQRNPGIENFKPPKILWSFLSFEIWSTHPGLVIWRPRVQVPPWPLAGFVLGSLSVNPQWCL